MKDEICDVNIKSFIGLKPKMQTFKTEDNHKSKRAKSINKHVVNYELKYEDYKIALFNKSYIRH